MKLRRGRRSSPYDGAFWRSDPECGIHCVEITEFKPRVSVTLPNEGYWDQKRVPKLDRMFLFPMPEPTTRLAALRSGQVDWIEVPPPDAGAEPQGRRV